MSDRKNTPGGGRRKFLAGRPSGTDRHDRGKVFPGGTPQQQFGLLIAKLAWVVLDTPDYLRWKDALAEDRRKQRGRVWYRFVAHRDDPVIIGRLRLVFDEPEVTLLLGHGRGGVEELPPKLTPGRSWGGRWNTTPWRCPSSLVQALAGVKGTSIA
jgi:hypothetical protein